MVDAADTAMKIKRNPTRSRFFHTHAHYTPHTQDNRSEMMGLGLMLGVVLLVLPYAATSRPTAAEVMDGVQVHRI